MGPVQSLEGKEQGSQRWEFALSCLHPFFFFLLCYRLFIMQLILLCVFIRAVTGVFPFSVFPHFCKMYICNAKKEADKKKIISPSPANRYTKQKQRKTPRVTVSSVR